MRTNYYKTKLVKMGRWALMPADLDNWFTEETSHHFKKIFGFGKGILIICTLYDGGWEHAYTPVSYIQKLHNFIRNSTAKDYKSLERKLLKFYILKKKLKEGIPKVTAEKIKKLSNRELIKIYKKNRSWVHKATVFDQFGWITEDYWDPVMKDILTKKFEIKADSKKYHKVLFTLTKPERISTTLEEKRAILRKIIELKKRKTNLEKVSNYLARKYGWMPVSAYGDPWDRKHYKEELNKLLKRSLSEIKKEYNQLESYTKIRNQEINKTIEKYKISKKDLQIFIDFGLVLDARNEAEYLVSFCGFYMLPIYKEIAKRLALSIKQVRILYEDEIVNALLGKLNYEETIHERRRICGYGYNKEMTKRFYFTPREAERLFKHLEKRVKYMQDGDEQKGLCASPGKVKGKVKIVISPDQNKKVEKGDVMIAIATMVDHLPAMKNAAAIVTEVGSLTCHAAVISREFGVPCIVALKNATKNFKDNQLVEVDAERGIIRKLK